MFDPDIYDYEVEKEMHNYKKNALRKLSVIVHPNYAESFGKILHYAVYENVSDAQKIADDLNLGPIDFMALVENRKEFEELLIKDLQYAQNF
jgi:hypothetical protein